MKPMATCEHANTALSLTYPQSIGGGGKLGEPNRSNLDTPVPAAPEDQEARFTSPRAALLKAPMSMPRITQSQSKPWHHRLARGWPHPPRR
jgi:hypothetical protein